MVFFRLISFQDNDDNLHIWCSAEGFFTVQRGMEMVRGEEKRGMKDVDCRTC